MSYLAMPYLQAARNATEEPGFNFSSSFRTLGQVANMSVIANRRGWTNYQKSKAMLFFHSSSAKIEEWEKGRMGSLVKCV